jgi:hypothetical protein
MWTLSLSFHPPFRLSPAAACHPFISPLWSAWSSLLLIIHSLLATCPIPLHVSLSPEGEFFPSVILLSSRHSFHALITWHEHSCHAPHPPRWPPYMSLKLFSYSRWQREKSSRSRSVELAGPFSIPRSSY